MQTVSISELKAKLSRYLGIVKRGGEVQILDRGVPVAMLVGVRGAERENRWERLTQSGVLRAGTGDASEVLANPPLVVRDVNLTGAVSEERGDRL